MIKKEFCKYCGGKLEADTKKCTVCGRFNGKPIKPKKEKINKEKNPFKLSKGVFIVTIIFSLIVGAGATFGVTYLVYEGENGIIAEREETAYNKGKNHAKSSQKSTDTKIHSEGYKEGYVDGWEDCNKYGYSVGAQRGRYQRLLDGN